jgi:hypothetical protein
MASQDEAMYITWATSPMAGGCRALQQASRLGGLPVHCAPDRGVRDVGAACSSGGAAPQQQPATLAQEQDAAARRRLIDAVQRSQADAVPTAANGNAAELQHLLSLQGLPARCAQPK